MISAKVLFPNKLTLTDTGDLDLSISFWETQFSPQEDLMSPPASHNHFWETLVFYFIYLTDNIDLIFKNGLWTYIYIFSDKLQYKSIRVRTMDHHVIIFVFVYSSIYSTIHMIMNKWRDANLVTQNSSGE